MVFNKFEYKLIGRVTLLLFTLSLPAFVLLQGWPEVLLFLFPLVAYQVYELLGFLRRAQQELNQFIESVHYRDFSRFYDEKNASSGLQALRKGFNRINATFRTISREKETQYQNLQQIMELVDTGIMSYDLESGQILFINESLKKLLQVPLMKTIQALAQRDAELFTAVQDLRPGQVKIATAYSRHLEKNSFKVLLSATVFQNDGRTYKLVAFQNVNEALEETESQAWQKLLNVMTHEIMNSVAPISSLADTLKNRLQQAASKHISRQDVEDLEVGISTIKRRSEGLLRFADTYRNLNRITTLNLAAVSIKELFGNLHLLMQPTLAQKNIRLKIVLPDHDISLQADPSLLDQVLINLIVNAMEAAKNQPKPEITLSAYLAADKKVTIRVADNGIGMTKEVQEKIFIPFFSTKKQGSGIGLSLCKQIVLLHRGTLQVQSVPGEGTAFILRLS
jgi:two-component system, NtrC family, nitrogen regulation sensor histidine kinase NtrY